MLYITLPHYCPKCKQEILINVRNSGNCVSIIKETALLRLYFESISIRSFSPVRNVLQ
ncbi:MAG: hypothetical protein HDR06_06385 [Lachnospiraceae bacterium]|nr:hypothetical protein [Lachnospiraceae bacterium]